MGFAAHDPRLAGLLNPLATQASSWFMEAYGMPATLFIGALNKPWFRPLVYAVERSTIPGILLHYILRKRFLQEAAHKILAQNVSQVVVLGAGFDMLSVYLHGKFPQSNFLEMDYPATQAAKRKALRDKSLTKDNLKFLSADFMNQTLEASLLNCLDYQPHKDTLFIAEGVLMYLSQADVDKLFSFVRNHAGPGSRFVFTFMEPRHDGKVNFKDRSKIVDFWMHLRGEPFTWGMPKDQLSHYLGTMGFSQEDLGTADVFRQRYLNGNKLSKESLAEGEYVCVAKRS